MDICQDHMESQSEEKSPPQEGPMSPSTPGSTVSVPKTLAATLRKGGGILPPPLRPRPGCREATTV